MPTDAELLHRYVQENAQEAFAEFVRRHVGLVYAAALRRTNGRTHLAEEIAQKVFGDLSHKAGALQGHPNLSGWLYCSTRYAAIDALRAEQRRAALTQSFSAMHDSSSAPDPQADWEQLRPVLDEAMDALKERERELMLLRFFAGMSFSEVGARLGLSENAARKRTDRALEKLRTLLSKRGISSSSAALSLLLSHQALASAPAGLAARVATVALSTPPATGLAGMLLNLLLGKISAPLLCSLAGAGLVTAVWNLAVPSLRPERETLQREYALLCAANAETASGESVSTLAADYAQRATAIAQALIATPARAQGVKESSLQRELSPHGYENLGRASAADAIFTFAWACDVSDPEALSALVYFDDSTRAHAERVLLNMPQGVRALCPTPETFYGLLLAAACLEAPPPDISLARRMMNVVPVRPDRVATRRVGSDVNFHEFQQTSDGWKYVLPEEALESLPALLNRATLTNLSRRQP